MLIKFSITHIIQIKMGQSISNEQQLQFSDMLKNYTIDFKNEIGTLLKHRRSKETFMLKQITFIDYAEYKKAYESFKLKQAHPAQSLLALIEVEGRVRTNICSGTYKIFLIYEYPNITLDDEIGARAIETRYFQEEEVWSILQSCLNGLQGLTEKILLDTKKIFITNDGEVKVIDPNISNSDSNKFIVTEGVYYSPERFQNFNKTDRGNSEQKEMVFSLGMSILHAALLENCFDCYDYAENKYKDSILQEKLNKVCMLYSSETVKMLENLLELNPNRRATVRQVEQMIENRQDQPVQEEQKYYQKSNSQKIEPLRSSKKQDLSQTLKSKQIPSQTKPIFFKDDFKENRKFQIRYSNNKQSSTKNAEIMDNFYNRPTLVNTHVSKNLPSYIPQPATMIFPQQQTYVSTFTPTNYKYLQSPKQPYYPIVTANYIPSTLPLNNNNENLFTDPKLLELLRQDLNQIKMKKNSFSVVTDPYVPKTYPGSLDFLNYTHTTSKNVNLGYQQHRISVVNETIDDQGRRYEGKIVKGNKEGFGKLVFPDGTYYEGQFSNNKMHGFGKMYYEHEKLAYEGYWKQNKFHGKGKLYNQKPTKTTKPFDYRNFNNIEEYWQYYEGDFLMDNKHGEGELRISNGESFMGQFQNDQINGKGRYFSLDHIVHTGIWQENMLLQQQNLNNISDLNFEEQ